MSRRWEKQVLCWALALTAGCARYEPMPLNQASVNARLAIPPADVLRVKAAEIRHPILRPVTLDARRGLTPDQAAVVAVLVNPTLRAARNQRAVAAAQVFSAGILPNPQVSLSEDFSNGGADTNTVNAYVLGLSWDVTQLITRGAKIDAARAAAASVDLGIAWQEWQVAEAAKAAVYDLVALRGQLAQAQEVDRTLARNAALIRRAVDRHEKTVLDLAAAEAASLDAHTAVLTAGRDVRHQQLALKRAIGVSPDVAIEIRSDFQLPSRIDVPSRADALGGLENRRLDLVALRKGYESQEQTLRAAVLAQFPRINIGFNKARDNTNVHSLGFGVTADLPIFDRNQGGIATETATRQKLFDEYVQRVFEARSDVAAAVDDIRAIQDQIAAAEAALPGLQKLVETYRAALGRGNVDVLSYYTAVGNLAQKRIDVLKFKQQMMDNRVALEIASGQYLPAPLPPASAPATLPDAPPQSGGPPQQGGPPADPTAPTTGTGVTSQPGGPLQPGGPSQPGALSQPDGTSQPSGTLPTEPAATDRELQPDVSLPQDGPSPREGSFQSTSDPSVPATTGAPAIPEVPATRANATTEAGQ